MPPFKRPSTQEESDSLKNKIPRADPYVFNIGSIEIVFESFSVDMDATPSTSYVEEESTTKQSPIIPSGYMNLYEYKCDNGQFFYKVIDNANRAITTLRVN